MRRGGILLLLIGLILILGAAAFFFFLQPGGVPGIGTASDGPTALPTEDPGVEIVTAKVDIPSNTVISDVVTLLDTQVIKTPDYNPAENFTSVNDIAGKLSTRSFTAGTAILKSGLTDPGLSQQIPTQEPDRPARDKAYPLSVNSLSGVADQIKPGDFVDVVATFDIERVVSLPVERRLEEQVQVLVRERTVPVLKSTKTIVQRAQVLRIMRPPVTNAEGTPVGAAAPPAAPESGPPVTDASGQPVGQAAQAPGGSGPTTITQGDWLLVLAINDQEIELIEFAQATEARVSLVLRGAGDAAFESTLGVTIDLLVAEFGLPLPRPVPVRVIAEDESLVPEPTRTPAPTRVP